MKWLYARYEEWLIERYIRRLKKRLAKQIAEEKALPALARRQAN